MSLAWSSVKALSIPVAGVSRDVKRVTAGGATLWEKAPAVPYDAEVEYLQSSGTQYIATGIIPTNKTAVDIGVIGPSRSVDVFGALPGRNNGAKRFATVLYNSLWLYYYGDFGIHGHTTLRDAYTTGLSNVSLSSDSITVNARRQAVTGSAEDFQCDRQAYVFKINGITITSGGSLSISYCRIYENGVLVRGYIPVRVGSGANAVGYLYDRANPTGGPFGNGLYPNSGSGAFVVGPDANA